MELFSDTQPDLLLFDADADNETLYGSVVDMQDYENVAFFCCVQKGEAATFSLKVQQGETSNLSDAADLAGTAKSIVIATGTDGFAFAEVKNPKERYVRPALVCPNVGTAKVVAIFAIRYGAKYLPETNSDGELNVAPAEGTA